MAAYPWLALAQDLGELTHRQLVLTQNGEDAQTRRLGSRPERAEQRFQMTFLQTTLRNRYINISLYYLQSWELI